ncbi:MAG: hypothetical protein ACRDQ5_22160 [Sciscionella sp.]
MHLLAGGDMHLVSGISYGDRERDQRVGVTDRRKAGKQHAHADEPTPDNQAHSDAFARSDGTPGSRAWATVTTLRNAHYIGVPNRPLVGRSGRRRLAAGSAAGRW